MVKTTKTENCYVALLRGINVGGNNLIKMADLRKSFEEMGFSEVQTYIQSGNVVFCAKQKNKLKLTSVIEAALSDAFGYESRVVIVSAEELKRVVDQAPKGFGETPDKYRYDVLFVREPLTTRELLDETPTNPDVDKSYAGDHAIYYSRLIAKATASRLGKLAQQSIYKSITVRNWNTTRKLFEMTQTQAG